LRQLIAVMAVLVASGCGVAGQGVLQSANGAFEAAKAKRGAVSKLSHGLGCRLSGLKRLENDDRALMAAGNRSQQVDLRRQCSPISDQGVSSACVGFATVDGLGEFLAKKQGRPMDLSPRYIWNLARAHDKSLNEDTGTWPHVAFKLADNLGFAEEQAFPFPTRAQQRDGAVFLKFVTEKPSASLETAAKRNRLMRGFKPIYSVSGMKKSIDDGLPVVFGVVVFPSFMETGSDGMIPMPRRGEKDEGGHAIVCVGYDNERRHFIIRNSWGTSWGDKGYGYLPFDFVKAGFAYEGMTAKL